jgi:hypothetical protein
MTQHYFNKYTLTTTMHCITLEQYNEIVAKMPLLTSCAMLKVVASGYGCNGRNGYKCEFEQVGLTNKGNVGVLEELGWTKDGKDVYPPCEYLFSWDDALAFSCVKDGILGDKKCKKYEEFVPYETFEKIVEGE